MSEKNNIEDLVNNAYEEILDEALRGAIESFRQLEQNMFDANGDPDETSEVWAIISSADKDDDQASDDSMSLRKIGSGDDIYEGLSSPALAVAHSLIKGKMGVLIRCGAWSAPTEEEGRPSDSPNRVSQVLTIAYAGKTFFLVARSDKETTVTVKKVNDLTIQDGKLYQAIMMFEMLPTIIKEKDPTMYAEVLEHIAKQFG